MEIKLIDKSNFTRDSLKGFRRYQEVKNVYRLKDVTYCAFEKNCVVGEIIETARKTPADHSRPRDTSAS